MFAPRKRPNRGLVPSLHALEERLCLSKIAPEVRPSARAEVSALAARAKVKAAPKPKAAKNPKAAVPNPKTPKPNPAAPKPHTAKPKPHIATPKPKIKAIKVKPNTPAQPPRTSPPTTPITPPAPPVTPTPPATPSNPDVAYLVTKLNADRAARGLQAVALDDGMSQSILTRMKEYHGAGHNHSGSGMDHGAGEVMSQDVSTAQQAYESMASDPTMLETMMDPNATKVGAATIWDDVSISFDNPYGRINTLYMMVFA
jgi:hypothetical protein